MDSIQKQILGYLLMAVVTAVVGYVTLKFKLWFTDPALLTVFGILLPSILTAALKWIKHTFNIPEEEEVELTPEQAEQLQKAVNGLTTVQLKLDNAIESKEKEIESLKKQIEELSLEE